MIKFRIYKKPAKERKNVLASIYELLFKLVNTDFQNSLQQTEVKNCFHTKGFRERWHVKWARTSDNKTSLIFSSIAWLNLLVSSIQSRWNNVFCRFIDFLCWGELKVFFKTIKTLFCFFYFCQFYGKHQSDSASSCHQYTEKNSAWNFSQLFWEV